MGGGGNAYGDLILDKSWPRCHFFNSKSSIELKNVFPGRLINSSLV